MTPHPVTDAVAAFAAEVGPAEAGPVSAVGGRTQWHVGLVDDVGHVENGGNVREVHAPSGVVRIDAADMTVRVGAGTLVSELGHAVAEVGQVVALPERPGATVGGVLAVGHSDVRRLGRGPIRDAPLQIRYVSSEGTVVTAGGPTVKNVSGFDLCRLFVGSLGTLGLLAEVVLRTRPLPRTERWVAGEVDPFDAARSLHRPSAVLWDGTTTWALLEGHPDDVASQAESAGLADVAGPPELPRHRWSVPPAALRTLAPGGSTPPGLVDDRFGDRFGHRFVAEIGVGVVHADAPAPVRPTDPAVAALNRRIKALFDPTGRLNPTHDPLGPVS